MLPELEPSPLTLVRFSKKKTEVAARIQEQFDIELFDPHVLWNRGLAREKVEEGVISESAMRYGWKKFKEECPWYADYSSLEKSRAVLKCQMENLNWEKGLKGSYTWLVAVIAVIVLFYGVGLYYHFDLNDPWAYFEKILLPQVGFLVYPIQLAWDFFWTTNHTLEIKKNEALKLYSRYQHSPEAIPKKELREIQDAIFENRKEGSLVPDWYYDWKRNNLQRTATVTAEMTNNANFSKP